jgi:hypothetical protein
MFYDLIYVSNCDDAQAFLVFVTYRVENSKKFSGFRIAHF